MHLEGSFIAIPMALPMVDLQLSPLWKSWTQRSKKSWQKSTDWKYLNNSVKRPKLPTLSLKLAGKWNCCLLDICTSWIILIRSFLIQWLYHLICTVCVWAVLYCSVPPGREGWQTEGASQECFALTWWKKAACESFGEMFAGFTWPGDLCI